MNKHRKLMAALVLSLCGLGSYAQTTTDCTYSLSELFQIADQQSRRIQVYQTARESADELVSTAKSARLPELNLSASASYIGDGWLADRHYRHGRNISMPHFGNNFAIELAQPIYAGGAITSGIRLAEMGQQMAALDLQQSRQDVRLQLTDRYLTLYKLRNQEEVLSRNIELVNEVLRNMKSRHVEGVVLSNDITRYELQLETLELQLTKLRDADAILNHQLVTTLQLPDSTRIVPDSTLLSQALPTITGEAEWQQQAATGNVGLQQAALARDMSRQQLRIERAARLPKVVIVAEDHLDGPILVEVPTINSNFNYWFVGLGVQYNISSLYKNNHSVRKAKLEIRRADEQHSLASEQIEQAVQAQYTDYLTTYTELRTREKNVQLADEHYDVVRRRYENELALLTELLDADAMKLSAELDLVNARIDLIGNYYKLQYITNSL